MNESPQPTGSAAGRPGTRTTAVATRDITNRMGRTYYLDQPLVWLVLIPAIVIVPTASLVFDAIGEPLSKVLLTLALGVLGGLALAGLFTWGFLYRAAAREWAQKVPEGTSMTAEFRPDEISTGWAGNVSTVPVDGIRWVRYRDRTATFTVAGFGTRLIIPDELMPPEIRDDLLKRYEGRRPFSRRPLGATVSAESAGPPPRMSRRVDHVDDAIRVEYIADEGLADRLRRSMLRPFTLGLFYLACLVPLVALLTVEAYAMAALPGAAIVTMSLLFFTPFFGRWWFRRTAPPGTPVSAEYGPDRIRLRLGTYDRTLDRASIRRVRRLGTSLQVTSRTSTDVLLIPDELLTPEIATGLLEEFGRPPWWRRLVDALRRRLRASA